MANSEQKNMIPLPAIRYMHRMVELFPARNVAVIIAGFPIYWYGILYLLSFVAAAVLLPRLQHLRTLRLSKGEWSDILTWAVVGVLLGGRFGYVLFYRFSDFLGHPAILFDVRSGGMASHGGFVGVALALLWALRCRPWSEKLAIADVAVVPIAIGLAFGRLGNFINQELYGTVTTLPWGMAFPGVDGLRHPTQLYAIAKDIFIALSCFAYLRRTKDTFVPGRALAIFLLLYGVLRFLVEIVRDQTGVAMYGPLSEGQVLTIPVLLAGLVLWMALGRGKR
jgi:phosphatidylglycerol:prolipoprotein diacylglycerol transferase